MSRPHKNPKTGVYYFRRVVPEDLRRLLGKREEKQSLGTKDPGEAKRRHAEIAAAVEKRWAGLRSGSRKLTQREIMGLAGLVYREWLDLLPDEPGETVIWERVLNVADAKRAAGQLMEWAGPSVDEVLLREGLVVDRPDPNPLKIPVLKDGLPSDGSSWSRLLVASHEAFMQAAEVHLRRSKGDYRPDPDASRFPPWEPKATTPTPPKPSSKKGGAHGASLTGLVDRWWKESQSERKPSTFESYQATFAKLSAFLKHDDAAKVTPADVIAFKDFRLSATNPRTGKPVSAKTVLHSDLAALKSVFGWAQLNLLIPDNPAKGVTLKLGKRQRLRVTKGHTDAETTALLRAALAYKSTRENPKLAAAKKWVPWLCAYTGARAGEVIQLRREDVRQEGEWWVIFITPEAGTVKTDEAREVVLHPHLVELGFPDFVKASKAGPLFVQMADGGTLLGAIKSVRNKVGAFAREAVKDPNVAPLHGLRHRFKTVGREAGVDSRVLDALQGHAPRTEGDDYGDVTIRARALAIERMPRVQL